MLAALLGASCVRVCWCWWVLEVDVLLVMVVALL